VEELRSLVVQATGGDIGAFERLVRRFQSMACGYAYSVLGDFHLAEDAAQEAFVDAYRQLPDLRTPEAFPGWFRRVVFKHCDRIGRGRRVPWVPLDGVGEVADGGEGPVEAFERREMRRVVREAVGSLPERQRQVTALFYLGQHSQQEIGDFLELPLTAVKKRLHDARKRMKERMLEMVGETLRENMPDELFSKKVIEELLNRPKPLEIEDHPVRRIWDEIRSTMAEFDLIEGKEIVDTRLYGSVQREMDVAGDAYQLDDDRILRTHLTHTMFQAIEGRQPPIRLLEAGRAFRPDREDERHVKVFHQIEGLCIEAGADAEALKGACLRVFEAVFGPVEMRWSERDFGFVDEGMDMAFQFEGEWVECGGCGLLKPEMLREAGFDADAVKGYAFGMGLDRMAMVAHRIDDIRDLWRAPYVPQG
jgi:RNA polymerase sigma factor (sigma-70 family)